MNFENKNFQKFLRMKDSDVEKLLNKKNPKASQYFIVGGKEIFKQVAKTSNLVLFPKGHTIRNDSYQFQDLIYTYSNYKDDKERYRDSFFSRIGNESTLNFIKRRAEFYYGEENVWLNEEMNEIIIKFPEILITNSVEDSHLMKDIFIKFSVRNGCFSTISIARTTVTELEIGRYIFSHASQNHPGMYSDGLCFGSTALGKWVSDAKTTNNFVFIDKIIASLDGYLSWESLEGKPYKYMSSIRDLQYNGRLAYYRTNSELHIAMAAIANSDVKLRYALSDDNGSQKVHLKNIHEIDEVLSKSEGISQHYRYKNESYLSLEKKSFYTPEHSEVIFKNERVSVIVESVESDQMPPKMCHKELLEEVIEAIEKELLNYLIKKEYE